MVKENGRDSAPAQAPRAPSGAERKALLEARVSTIIDAHADALGVLIEHGFTLLAQAPLRWAMAHTVNLAQAFRLRSLDAADQEALLAALTGLGVPDRLSRGARGHGPDADVPQEEPAPAAGAPGAPLAAEVGAAEPDAADRGDRGA